MSFIIKLLLNGVIAIPMLMWLAEIPFFTAMVASVLLTIVAYFIGDRFVLPESYNAFATYVDTLLAFGFLWWASVLFDWALTASEALAIAVLIGLAEVLFHRYLRNEEQARRAA